MVSNIPWDVFCNIFSIHLRIQNFCWNLFAVDVSDAYDRCFLVSFTLHGHEEFRDVANWYTFKSWAHYGDGMSSADAAQEWTASKKKNTLAIYFSNLKTLFCKCIKQKTNQVQAHY